MSFESLDECARRACEHARDAWFRETEAGRKRVAHYHAWRERRAELERKTHLLCRELDRALTLGLQASNYTVGDIYMVDGRKPAAMKRCAVKKKARAFWRASAMLKSALKRAKAASRALEEYEEEPALVPEDDGSEQYRAFAEARETLWGDCDLEPPWFTSACI